MFSSTRIRRPVTLAIACAASLAAAARASAQEPMECLSFNPADWPDPARPYFMLVVDTSGSMTACTTPPTNYPTECNQNAQGYQLNSCGMVPNRMNDAKCALRQTVQAFAGQVSFGLATYASRLSGCSSGPCQSGCGSPNGGTCDFDYYEPSSCDWNTFPGTLSACGNEPACNGAGPQAPNWPENSWLNGANVVVDMLQDPWWAPPGPASNVDQLLEWFDGRCDGSRELFAAGGTPIAGSLRAVTQYFRAGWSMWTTSNYCNPPAYTSTTPLSALDRGCRDVNVLLVTDGDDTCGTASCGTPACGQADAVAAASDLFNNGVTLGSKNWPVRTHVINFAGGNQTNTDAIAAAGGTGSSLFATNEVQLAQALADIIASAVQPETCDNADNNCNGCTDEGYKHYCNINQTCCSWSTETQRDQCLANYQQSVTNNPPDGDPTLLPCTTASEQQDPAHWLCFNPGDVCDEGDNNCQDGSDEGQLKCGSPAHCPTTEVCNGQDDDCDGQTDENVCSGCVPSSEVCDGCDNDCDGVIDNPPPGGFPTIACGLPSPANCTGTMACEPPATAPNLGGCLSGQGYVTCSNNPLPEVCDGQDNDCDLQVDEGYVSSGCVPSGHPPGLTYGASSQCQLGAMQCINGSEVCVGGTGPGTEICDGADNDCDGVVDDNAFGTGQSCGINNPPCSPGTTQCVSGSLQCVGGVGPQTEVCDGADNDCDGNVDEAPLGDAPSSPGCWNNPGSCCTHQNLSWCPPPGGSCSGVGNLTAPCNVGTLVCSGGAWACLNPKGPSGEVCDGTDNDCNGTADDGMLPGVNQPCGTNVGECQEGVTQCLSGILDCVGDVGPTQETCDGCDNDCDGFDDNGIPAQGACNVAFDPVQFPNSNPTQSPCQQGQLECDPNLVCGSAPSFICVGGKGPEPELCDGIDNDCDGSTDETGPAPDGIDGSANPFPPPAASIGDACGVSQGTCEPGAYACLNGLFACLGGTAPTFEECDCEDNDCDGQSDEPPGPNEPPLCSPGKDCVQASTHCQCASPCSGGEYPCPTGQKCETVQLNTGGTGNYCVTDFDALCGDCSVKTVTDTNMQTVCAPAGSDPPGCMETPECVCRGPAGCGEPCLNVTCGTGKVCSNFGPKAGECVDDICYLTLCPGCDQVCHDFSCVDNPCKSSSCPPGEVCKPSADFTSFTCVPSCADVSCPSGHICEEGQCVPGCDPPCTSGQVCDPDTLTCVDDKCTEDSCPDGRWCNPVTGACEEDPCTGIVCPDGQFCEDGECFGDDDGGGGQGSGAGGAAGPGSGAGGETVATDVPSNGVFGLPTGGGGCGCQLPGQSPERRTGWLGLALVVLAARRRRVGRARA